MADPTIAPAIISATAGLLGTIVGGAVTYWTQRWQRRADRAEDCRTFAAAVAAEVGAYLELVRRRNHAASMKYVIEHLRSGHDFKLSDVSLSTQDVQELFPIFFAQREKIGMLGEVAPDLSRFLTTLSGIIVTLRSGQAGKFDAAPLGVRADIVESELALYEEAVRLGESVVSRLRALG